MSKEITYPQRMLLWFYYLLVMLPAWELLRYIDFSKEFIEAFCASWFAFWIVDTLRGKQA